MYKEGGWWKKLYTCNYGPGGNIIRQQMYRRGSPCSACPADTTCSPKYPGLCGKSNSRRTGSSFCKGQLESVVYDLPKIKKKIIRYYHADISNRITDEAVAVHSSGRALALQSQGPRFVPGYVNVHIYLFIYIVT